MKTISLTLIAICISALSYICFSKSQVTKDYVDSSINSVINTNETTNEKTNTRIEISEERLRSEFELHNKEVQFKEDIIEYKKSNVEWWLDALAIWITLVGIALPIIGWRIYVNTKSQIQEVKKESEGARDEIQKAKESIDKAKIEVDAAKNEVFSEIYEHREKVRVHTNQIIEKNSQADEILNDMTLRHSVMKSISLGASSSENEGINDTKSLPNPVLEIDTEKSNAEKYNYIKNNIGDGQYKLIVEYANSILSSHELKTILTSEHDEAIFYFNIAYAFSVENDFDNALKYYNVIIDKFKNYDRKGDIVFNNLKYSYVNRSVMWMEKKEYDRALQDLDIAQKLDPKEYLVDFNYGNVAMEQNKYNDAISHFENAIKKSPIRHSVYHRAGVAYNMLKKYNLAEEYYSKAINLSKSISTYYASRAINKYHQKIYDGAIFDATYALDVNNWRDGNSPAIAYMVRAMSYVNLGEYEKAELDYQRLLSLQPKDQSILLNYSELLLMLGKTSQAKAVIEAEVKRELLNRSAQFGYDFIMVFIKILESNNTILITPPKELTSTLTSGIEQPISINWSFNEISQFAKNSRSITDKQRDLILALIDNLEEWRQG
ncbi:MAG: tetratricopeptide repeat protein [Chitinophagales bacterium]|nr:tetratricopeptide repeat protein [Chitinophagaceae bacterium]MCB9064995.1 tetratricopeptide repeat protein [Chitinophagales bacterium]